MSDNTETSTGHSQMELELYFLVAKFLANGPCKKAAEVLSQELESNQLLPKRVDWEGNEHYRSYESLVQMFKHVAPDHLYKICERIGPILDKEIPPNVPGVRSLLGAGRQSLLRTKEGLEKAKWPIRTHCALRYGLPLAPPIHMTSAPNVAITHFARNISGLARTDQICALRLFSKFTQLSRSLGHLSAVYCATFDRTGNYIITGADDHLVKIWSSVSGRLIATLRGHSAEIADMAISYDNKLLATGSCDKTVRIWNLKNTAPIAILHGHTGLITSIKFCPMPRGDTRYVASTGTDGVVCFWSWNIHTKVFNGRPIKFIEKSRAGAQMLCSSFSPGGVFLATGSSDNVIRVYSYGAHTFEKICELEAHGDRVDSIQYSNHSTRFISGSKEGIARIWRYERQEWKNVVLNMAFLTPGQTSVVTDDARCPKPRVTMVAWSCDDEFVLTAVTDLKIKVWNSHTGKLVRCLEGHQDEVYVLEQNPMDPRLLLSAGHDGYIMIWDIHTATVIKHFYNNIQGQGHGAVFDCKWAPDGKSFASTDSHGFLRYFGFGSNDNYKQCPDDQFFHTDYRPLIRDSNDYVLDEQTQLPPHLMPPAFLVNLDGNPHPPKYQRLVPGREHCKETNLAPQMGVTPSGDREVLDQAVPIAETIPIPVPASTNGASTAQGAATSGGTDQIIDHMITRMQQEQDERIVAAGGEPLLSPSRSEALNSPLGSPLAEISGIEDTSMRRDEPQEDTASHAGESQSPQAQHPQFTGQKNISVWNSRVCVKSVDRPQFRSEEKVRQAMMDDEVRQFVLERKKKPVMPSENESSDSGRHIKTRKKQKPRNYRTRAAATENEETTRNRLTTRALYDTEVEDNEEEEGEDEGAIDIHSEDGWKSDHTDGNSSTEYSDWAQDGDTSTLQPPTRRSKRRITRRKFSSSVEDDEDEEGEEDVKVDDEDDEETDVQEAEYESDDGEGHIRRSSRRSPSRKQNNRIARKPVRKKPRAMRRQAPQVIEMTGITELKEEYRPPEWLSDSVPRKSPYFPQMGDELIYLRQGHAEYVKTVNIRQLYDIDENNQPWMRNPHLREHELVKVVGCKYEFKKGGNGVRLVCLKLNPIDPDSGRFTGGSFSIKYHDVNDVVDFLVLRQIYDAAIRRRWKSNDKFKAIIEDSCWFGTIKEQIPLQAGYPDSLFLCYSILWDSGEMDRMSPWDIEPISRGKNNPQPLTQGGSIQVTTDDLLQNIPVSKDSDWPGGSRAQECDRIAQGLEQIMELSIAEPFLAPVDLQAFPLYAMTIEYPVDLSLIKARLEHRFYRRVAAVQFDVRYIESNAKAFNRHGSEIVHKAKLVTELCLRLIRDTECMDIMPIYNELVKDTEFAMSDGESVESGPSFSRVNNARSKRNSRSRRNSSVGDPYAWLTMCSDLLDTILSQDDSIPFRVAVDPEDYPDYYQLIENPMDLVQVKHKISSAEYDNPMEFAADLKLIFHNSRTFNTNKRSRIYTMTLRLSAMCEDQMQPIIEQYKTIKGKNKGKGKSSSRLPAKVSKRENIRRSVRDAHHHATTSTSPESTSLVTRASSSRGNLQSSSPSTRRISTSSTSPLDKPIRRAGRRGLVFQESFEEEMDGESDKENKSDSETDVGSDYEVTPAQGQRSARHLTIRRTAATSSRRHLVNGSSSVNNSRSGSRYVTRTQTGSTKRKHYDHSDSGEEQQESGNLPQHRKKTRLKVSKTSSEEDIPDEEEDEEDEVDPIPVRKSRRGMHLRNKKASSSDGENDSSGDASINDGDGDVGGDGGGDGGGSDHSDDSNTEDAGNTDDEQQASESALSRPRRGRGGSRAFPSRNPPPLLSNRGGSFSSRGAGSRKRRLSSGSSGVSPPQPSSSRSSQRSSRISGVNYAQYFDEDDDENRVSSSGRMSTRNQGRASVKYEDDSDFEDLPVSISSRGRVRKVNSRMRDLFDS